MFHYYRSIFLTSLLLIVCAAALPSSAGPIEIDPDGLTVESCQQTDAEASCVEAPGDDEPEASPWAKIQQRLAIWLESARARFGGWLCR